MSDKMLPLSPLLAGADRGIVAVDLRAYIGRVDTIPALRHIRTFRTKDTEVRLVTSWMSSGHIAKPCT